MKQRGTEVTMTSSLYLSSIALIFMKATKPSFIKRNGAFKNTLTPLYHKLYKDIGSRIS